MGVYTMAGSGVFWGDKDVLLLRRFYEIANAREGTSEWEICGVHLLGQGCC